MIKGNNMPIFLKHKFHCDERYLEIARNVTQKYIEEVGISFVDIDELDDRIGCAIQKTVLDTAKEIYQLFSLWDWITEE